MKSKLTSLKRSSNRHHATINNRRRNERTTDDESDSKENEAEEQYQIRYLDLSRMIEVNDLRRFQMFAVKADLNSLQIGNKPFLFYAISKDEINLARFLLDQEIDLSLEYPVEVKMEKFDDNELAKRPDNEVPHRNKQRDLNEDDVNNNNEDENDEDDDNNNNNDDDDDDDNDVVGGTKPKKVANVSDQPEDVLDFVQMNALEYSKQMGRTQISELIELKLKQESLHERWLRTVANGDTESMDIFLKKFKTSAQLKDALQMGLIRSCEIGSIRLIDYFIGHQKLDLNYTYTYQDHLVTPLLIAIEYKRVDAAKYLIFRKADINLDGEYGNALVTAIHYECPNELVTLLLEKGASLASRHKDWMSLNLREYCVQLNKVKSKAAIDDFVFRLIANGEYEKLKSLVENGYLTINVMNRFRKTGRDLAIERCHANIVQLIDKIEYRQRRLRTKMNY